ncbi:hypothetical protein SteCoe_25834 [Stentor coeruleus]|uniref:Uncharacterized protein n=1 Tax=Stentor coeruleus TaxID=5963 RepID=A0A1R2BEA5_9CILI|nr:hypothetical protein SteCoe_25834 [Stentor coeruleus]
MGSQIILGALAGTSTFNAFGASVLHKMNESEHREGLIETIEERCEGTFTMFGLGIADHSFIVFKTDNGEHVRADFTSFGKITITYFYYPDESTVTFRKSKLNTKLPLSQGLEIFSNHAKKSPYNIIKHNCQHVARDTFNEITNSSLLSLRNDHIWLMRKNASPESKKLYPKITEDIENAFLSSYKGRDIRNCLFNDEKYQIVIKKLNIKKIVKNTQYKDSVFTNPEYCLFKPPKVIDNSGRVLSDEFRKWLKEVGAIYF